MNLQRVATWLVGGVLAMVYAAAWAAAGGDDPAPPSWLDYVVLGIPLGVLAASLAGSSARTLREESQPDNALFRKVVTTIVDGFIGGWLAMFLIGFSYTRPFFAAVTPAVLGALCGLLCEFLRSNGPTWLREAKTAVTDRFAKKGAPAP